MLNIPILYLDAIGKVHIKKSFNKFYKIIKNKDVILFIKKHEDLRRNWSFFYQNNEIINKKIVDYLGKNYFNNCLKTLNYCIKKII